MQSYKRGSVIAVHIVLILGALAMVIPFVWMILTAFKTQTEATSINPFVFFPTVWVTGAFEQVTLKMDFVRTYWNTLALIFWRVVAALVTASMAGYALGRLQFRGKGLCFGLVMFQMMVPSQIFVLPQYLMVSRMSMLNTVFALIFPGLVTAFGTFLLRQTYMSLPRDLEEAAKIDGCNIGQSFFFIMLPLTKSNLVALSIFTSLFAYKELLWPMIVNTNQNYMTLSSALAKLQGQFRVNYPELMAASMLACIPMIVIYLIFQKQFVQGIATTGGKL